MPSDEDRYEDLVAALADAKWEGLTLHAMQAAYDVASSTQEFFWAIQASVRLKEICNEQAA